ncbi:MAG: bifunctional glycosyltransferase family 2/GtrA family protein [Desulfobacteraceae bacterium]|nr:bifunctional glycosyltransferase family 2/GtrA family protein [Desulfobacteraceae bacterium]
MQETDGVKAIDMASGPLPVIIIPAYQPSKNLIELVDHLLITPYPLILIVNDGSSKDCAPIFETLSQRERVTVISHAVNLGKGQALKTAFNYVLLNKPLPAGVLTVDADGQHLPEDILHVARDMMEHPGSLCLGAREFEGRVPLRSRLGNAMTRHVFRFFVGKAVSDTQSGLRGIPLALLGRLLRLQGTGYEFELEMLVLACKTGIDIREVKIKTVYEKGNPSSHFNPVLDSMKIYFVFIRFISASLASFFIDTAVFSISLFFTGHILFSMVMGRIISGTFNFLTVKMVVFQSRGNPFLETAKYISLVITLMFISYGLIKSLVVLCGVNPYLAKIAAETTLFFASFSIQRSLIFQSGQTT